MIGFAPVQPHNYQRVPSRPSPARRPKGRFPRGTMTGGARMISYRPIRPTLQPTRLKLTRK